MIDSELFPDEASEPQPLRLFCFPHAGGGTSQFYRWRRYCSNVLAILPARLPGRESRLHQKPIASLDELARIVAETIAALPPGPFALLGYSVGAHLAYRVASYLPRQGDQAPLAMVMVASNGPGVRKPEAGISELPDEQFIDYIHHKYGGIPAIVRQDPAWLAAVVPALRADLAMLQCEQQQAVRPLTCPLLAIGGTEDTYVPVHGLAAWGAVTQGPLTTRQFPGGHFFLYPDFASLPAGSGTAAAKAPPPLAAVFQFVQQSAGANGQKGSG